MAEYADTFLKWMVTMVRTGAGTPDLHEGAIKAIPTIDSQDRAAESIMELIERGRSVGEKIITTVHASK